MSAKSSLGYAEDRGQSLHIYRECFDEQHRVHIDLRGENGMEATMIIPAALFDEVLKSMAETARQIDKLRDGGAL